MFSLDFSTFHNFLNNPRNSLSTNSAGEGNLLRGFGTTIPSHYLRDSRTTPVDRKKMCLGEINKREIYRLIANSQQWPSSTDFS